MHVLSSDVEVLDFGNTWRQNTQLRIRPLTLVTSKFGPDSWGHEPKTFGGLGA